MLDIFRLVTVILVVVAVTLTLGHALELPGKRRLSREAYTAMQPIYYPGFTIAAGIGEAGGMLATIVLLILTPVGGADFWLTLVAAVAIVAMHGVYWLITHPVNKFWLQGQKLGAAGSGFFSFASGGDAGRVADWTVLRDRWEYSHVARAVLAIISLVALLIAML